MWLSDALIITHLGSKCQGEASTQQEDYSPWDVGLEHFPIEQPFYLLWLLFTVELVQVGRDEKHGNGD